jgi:hypothetical protein
VPVCGGYVNDTSYVRLIFEYVCALLQRISRDAEYYSDIASGSDSLGFDNRIRFILRFVLILTAISGQLLYLKLTMPAAAGILSESDIPAHYAGDFHCNA